MCQQVPLTGTSESVRGETERDKAMAGTTKRKTHEATPTTIRAAYKGTPFSFTYNASQIFFRDFLRHDVTLDQQPQASLKDVFQSVQSGDCDYGIVPAESSSFGSINSVYERLLGGHGAVKIVGEIGVVENLPLCLPGDDQASRDVDIAEVLSHPHILECCGDYLDRLDAKRASAALPKIVRTASWDTAAACAAVAQQAQAGGIVKAAICSREAAAHFKMRIVEETVNSFKNAEVCVYLLRHCRVSPQIPKAQPKYLARTHCESVIRAYLCRIRRCSVKCNDTHKHVSFQLCTQPMPSHTLTAHLWLSLRAFCAALRALLRAHTSMQCAVRAPLALSTSLSPPKSAPKYPVYTPRLPTSQVVFPLCVRHWPDIGEIL